MTSNSERTLEHRYAGGSPASAAPHHAVTAALTLIALGLGGWLYWSPPNWTSVWAPPLPAPRTLDDAQTAANRTRIATAVETYRVLEEAYPQALEDLVARGLLRPRDLYYSTTSEIWKYSTREDGFRLTAPTSATSD